MHDSMEYVFEDLLEIRQGEVVRFVVTNEGELLHEFSIGNAEEQKRHAAMMRKMPDMVHQDGNTLSLKPGETGELLWRFQGDPAVVFACNVPGHYEAGMYKSVSVAPHSAAQEPTHSHHEQHDHHNMAADDDFVAFTGLELDAAKAVAAFSSALTNGEKAKALQFLHENLLIFEGGSVERSATQYAGNHMDADITFFSGVKSELIERHVQQSGDMALATSRLRVTGLYDGEDIDSEGMESLALQRIDGQWKIIHIHWSNF